MLKKFISESFFNPVLHILPIIIFIVVDDYWGDATAWLVSATLTVAISAYIYIFYKTVMKWYLISAIIFIVVGLIVTFFRNSLYFAPYQYLSGEITALFFLLLLLIFRNPVEKVIKRFSGGRISMTNNLNELIRINIILSVILGSFIVVTLIVTHYVKTNQYEINTFVYHTYTVLMLLAVIYEFIRVFAIRGKLLKEEWLPIVNSTGKEIGAVNYQISLWSEDHKYIHPVVRVIVLEENRIFMQQHNLRSELYSTLWDNAISGHLKLGEKIPECIDRMSASVYQIKITNPVFLGNYEIENSCEFQYVHLFLACRLPEVKPNADLVDRVKWWTINQIQENLNAGIFTDNFVKEFEILQRSGLIESGRCSCECKLKEQIRDKN